MKLAIDCRMIGSGGIGTYISELIPHFLKNNQCLLLGTHEQCTPFVRLQNVEFCHCDVKPFSFEEMFSFPSNVLKEINNCDAYYTPYCNIPGGINIPVFSTIHDVVFLDVKGLSSFTGTFLRRLIYLRAVNNSKAIFTVSEFSKERIIHHLHCKKPVLVGYNGISSWLLKNEKSEEAVSNTGENSCSNDNSILFVGNIKKHKGLSVLLDAFEIARKTKPDLQLVIVGNAVNFRSGDDEVIEKLKNLPDNAITFTGKISNEELKKQYKNAKLLVQPSFYEGFGIPPLEALYCKTNAIISDIPVFKEIYKDFPVTFFKTGDADDLAEKILSHLDDAEPENIPEIYSYKKTAEIILSEIKQIIKP